MKKLPKLYKNESDKTIDNNKKICHLKMDEDIIKENNIEEVLDSIFNGLGHAYNTKVMIKTKDKLYETYIVSRTSKNIVTLDNDVISISDILYIKK